MSGKRRRAQQKQQQQHQGGRQPKPKQQKKQKQRKKKKAAQKTEEEGLPLTVRTLQELCADADLYGLLQMLRADSDSNLQLAWFWNAVRFVDAGVDDPLELSSLLATEITEDLLESIYSVDTEDLGFQLDGALQLLREANLDVNAPLDLKLPLFGPEVGAAFSGGGEEEEDEEEGEGEGEKGIVTALHLASEVGHAGITHILLRLKADPHVYDRLGRSPMCVASSKSFNLVVDEILRCDQFNLRKGGSKKEQELYEKSRETAGRALLAATLDKNAKIVQQLLDADADVNYTDIEGVGVLQHAASQGQLLIVQRALAKGASLNNDCLSRACDSGNLATVMYLVEEAGVDVNAVDETDSTPLMHAAAAGHLEVVEYLCLRKADFDKVSDNHGESAITLAAQEAHVPVVEYLSGMWNAKDANRARALLLEALKERKLQEAKAKEEEDGDEEWRESDDEGDSEDALIAMEDGAEQEEEEEDNGEGDEGEESEDSMDGFVLEEGDDAADGSGQETEEHKEGSGTSAVKRAGQGRKRKQPDEEDPSQESGSESEGLETPQKPKRVRRRPPSLHPTEVSPLLTPIRRSRRLKDKERRARNQRRKEMLEAGEI